MKYIHRFAQGLHLRQVDMLQDGIAKSTATLSMMSKKLRRICVKSLKKHRKKKKQKVGGVNVIVHIDESKFCHKRKYGRGRFGNTWKRKRTWVFGILEIKAASRRPILRLVKRRNKETLVPIIKKHVKRESLVVSDEWRAYACLSQEGYKHVRVNHSQNYVDPQTGLHTQNIERAWQTYKREIWRMRGNRSENVLKKQLCFIEWTYWLARRHKHGVLGRLLKDIRNDGNIEIMATGDEGPPAMMVDTSTDTSTDSSSDSSTDFSSDSSSSSTSDSSDKEKKKKKYKKKNGKKRSKKRKKENKKAKRSGGKGERVASISDVVKRYRRVLKHVQRGFRMTTAFKKARVSRNAVKDTAAIAEIYIADKSLLSQFKGKYTLLKLAQICQKKIVGELAEKIIEMKNNKQLIPFSAKKD
ncbi:uncharacterized protein LOC128545399 isoform X2 [Clarias gariepinus]|nr:uncharacterized protein LOC128545399 isoform X2 [Clarias gariepinus]